MNGGAALVATLVGHGVDTAFAVPGESYLAVLEALRVNANRIRLVTSRHESGASYGAAVYARIARRPGIAFVTRGPGATNASIGVHCAMQDSLPLVLFVGHVPSHEKGRESFQEIDYRLMFAPMAKAVIEPAAPGEVASATARALALAAAGRPGPVVVVLPEDVTEGEAGTSPIPPPRPRASATATPEAAAEAARIVARARRPVVIAGELVNHEAAHGALRAFVERAGAGVVAAFRCQDAFDNDHPAYLGHFGIGRAPYQRSLWEGCDVVIAVGNRLDAITTEDYRVPRDDQVLVHIHPEPSVLASGRTADLAIAADVAPALAAVTALLPGGADGAWRDEYRAGFEAARAEPARVAGRLDMSAVVKEIGRVLPPDHVIVSEAGNFSGWVHRYFPFRHPGSQAAPMTGAMGWAVPGAIGAKLARPSAEVIAVVGDGGFGMTGQELATAVQEGLKITVIVCDNGAYGTILAHQHRFAGRGAYHGVRLRSPDFAALARAYGAEGFRVETTPEFAPAFAAARAAPGPALVHLLVDVRDISAYGPLDV
jgi:acetolactate synthase-1/2/3 large subunit